MRMQLPACIELRCWAVASHELRRRTNKENESQREALSSSLLTHPWHLLTIWNTLHSTTQLWFLITIYFVFFSTGTMIYNKMNYFTTFRTCSWSISEGENCYDILSKHGIVKYSIKLFWMIYSSSTCGTFMENCNSAVRGELLTQNWTMKQSLKMCAKKKKVCIWFV